MYGRRCFVRLAVSSTLAFLFYGIAGLAAGPTFVAGPTFDAASVKLWTDEIKQPYIITGGPGTKDPGRFHAPRINMSGLLARAFDVSTDQLTGPAWLRDMGANFYTIDATMPPDTTKEQFQKMVENLLIERFHLVFHHETRNFPGYELVVDKGGPKFKEVTPTESAPSDPLDKQAMLSSRGADGFPTAPGSRVVGMAARGGQQRTKYQERTTAQFISNLGFLIGSSQGKGVLEGYPQPRVVDKTGLTGTYTFILEYYNATMANLRTTLPLSAPPDAGNGTPPAAASDPGDGLPDIFTAIQKQLGLRLNKTADVPVDVIVVESVDKVPTGN
jgi:uncharacterized protein (TIGR03435 family)